jgi:hypothetical protein
VKSTNRPTIKQLRLAARSAQQSQLIFRDRRDADHDHDPSGDRFFSLFLNATNYVTWSPLQQQNNRWELLGRGLLQLGCRRFW